MRARNHKRKKPILIGAVIIDAYRRYALFFIIPTLAIIAIGAFRSLGPSAKLIENGSLQGLVAALTTEQIEQLALVASGAAVLFFLLTLIPLLLTRGMRNSKHCEFETGLPVLAVVPPMGTPAYLKRRRIGFFISLLISFGVVSGSLGLLLVDMVKG